MAVDFGKDKVVLPRDVAESALAYIRHCGTNQTESGKPHPQARLVASLESHVENVPQPRGLVGRLVDSFGRIADAMSGHDEDELDVVQSSGRRPQTMEGLLSSIRAAGWMVGVHNDYRLHGAHHTFWLFTNAEERCVKGEGLDDIEALSIVWDRIFREPVRTDG